jgi:hypothetical protein
MLLSHATVIECARAALALTSPGEDLDKMPDAVKRECINYTRFILAEGTPAEWHDMGVDRELAKVEPGWKYGPSKNIAAKTAPYFARFSDLPAEVQAEREAVAKAIHDARSLIKERHEAEKRAAEEEIARAEAERAAAEAKAESDRIAAEEHAKWRAENPEAAAEKDREEAEAKAAEEASIEAERAEAELAASRDADTPAEGAPVDENAAPTEVPPPPEEKAPEAPVEPLAVPAEPAPVLATSRRSRR